MKKSLSPNDRPAFMATGKLKLVFERESSHRLERIRIFRSLVLNAQKESHVKGR